MTGWMKAHVAVVFAAVLLSAVAARGQDNLNPRALDDIKAFQQKAEEGDTLFNQKKYAEAAAALAAAHASYERADKRDSSAGAYKISLKPETYPALRHYGYGMGSNASLTETVTGAIEGTAAGFHTALTLMWQDASILGNLEKGPLAGALSDPPLVDLTEEQLDTMVGTIYGPVSLFDLPVKDDEWREVVVQSRRAQLIVEHALAKYPEWKTTKRSWSNSNKSLNATGDEALADIKAKLAEAEPEYKKLVADFKSAEPKGVADTLSEELDTLNKAIAGVKSNGWVEWVTARDLFITNDYVAEKRKRFVPLYTAEGKEMPADKLKTLQDKAAELKSAMAQAAPRWKFPAGKPHDAAIEARAAAGVKAKFPGAIILKTALDDNDWTILKNDLGIPRYRKRGVLVLTQIPGQKLPWLIFGYLDQTYSGGGTFNPGGTFAPPFNQIRLQTAN